MNPAALPEDRDSNVMIPAKTVIVHPFTFEMDNNRLYLPEDFIN